MRRLRGPNHVFLHSHFSFATFVLLVTLSPRLAKEHWARAEALGLAS